MITPGKFYRKVRKSTRGITKYEVIFARFLMEPNLVETLKVDNLGISHDSIPMDAEGWEEISKDEFIKNFNRRMAQLKEVIE